MESSKPRKEPSEHAKFAIEAVKKIATGFTKPEDDLFPFVFLITPWEVKTVDARTANDREKLKLWNETLPNLVVRLRARHAIHVATMWYADATPEEMAAIQAGTLDPRNLTRPTQRPTRSEMACVNVISRRGVEAWSSSVVRTADFPPLLTEFESMDGVAAFIYAGVLRAIRHVN